MAGVQVTFNQAALDSISAQASNTELRTRANRVLSRARQLVPVDKGTLRASITVEFSDLRFKERTARIGSNLPYAIFVHEGTGIHGPRGVPIVPVRARFLVFTPKGAKRPVFARSVQGIKGVPFLTNALEAARD